MLPILNVSHYQKCKVLIFSSKYTRSVFVLCEWMKEFSKSEIAQGVAALVVLLVNNISDWLLEPLLRFIYIGWKRTRKRIFFLWSLLLLTVNIKLDKVLLDTKHNSQAHLNVAIFIATDS